MNNSSLPGIAIGIIHTPHCKGGTRICKFLCWGIWFPANSQGNHQSKDETNNGGRHNPRPRKSPTRPTWQDAMFGGLKGIYSREKSIEQVANQLGLLLASSEQASDRIAQAIAIGQVPAQE